MLRSVEGPAPTRSGGSVPEIKVVDRSLLIAHVYVEGEQIEGRDRLATEHFEQVGEPVAVELRRQR